MCTVSYVSDYWKDQFPQKWPSIHDHLTSSGTDIGKIVIDPPKVSRQEFEALKKEVQELRELLIAAKKFDEATGQHDCEMEEKVALIKGIAKYVGVDLKDIFE